MKTHDFAKKYLDVGWMVFPLRNKSKKPATANGFKDASTDPATVTAWFNNAYSNIAVATGLKSNIAVIDIDPKNGGLPSFEILKEIYHLDIDTPTVQTGSGGFHLYYSISGGVRSRTNILPGIDIKADGGYIVTPPSIHPNGKPYFFQGDPDMTKLKPFPVELIEKVDKDKKRKPRTINKTTDGKVNEGGRHNHLVSEMGRLRGLGFSQEKIRSELHKENATSCTPPLELSEVRSILDSCTPRSFEEVLKFSPFTDLGNAERFKAFCGNKVIYISQMNKWHIYDGTRFRPDSCRKIVQIAKQMLREGRLKGQGIFSEKGDNLSEYLRKCESHSKVTAMINFAQTEMPINSFDLDKNNFYFNVANGTLDLNSGILMPHDQKNLLTKISEIKFDSSAVCPRWNQFLSEVTLGSSELQDYIQRVIGYCLTGLTNEQCFWILHGSGSNGKSTFLSTVRTLLGEYTQNADISSFICRKSESVRNDLARLHDARLVTSVELNEGKLLDESVIKQVTGGDPVTARFLYQEYFDYIPKWKLFLAVNHLPMINGTDDGIWRRIKCIPFEAKFSDRQKDKLLSEKLNSELSGILNWALEGYRKWQLEGLSDPDIVKLSSMSFRRSEDFLQDFLDEHTVIDTSSSVNSTELFQKFVYEQSNLGQKIISQKLFGQKMRIKGFETKRGEGGRTYYIGLRKKHVI